MKELRYPLKLITYNIHSGKNLRMQTTFHRMLDYLESSQGQIMCIQEINENKKRGYQVNKIKSRLQKHCNFAPNVSIGKGYYGLANLTSLSIQEYHHILLPSEKEQRGLLHTILLLGNQELHIINTHLGLSKTERTRQFQFIREYLSRLKSHIILMGDFNTTKPELENLPLNDAAQITKQEHIPTYIPTRQRIDYIFVSASIKVVDYHVVSINLSDHYPVEVKVWI